jgi:hypothetical protein
MRKALKKRCVIKGCIWVFALGVEVAELLGLQR